MVVVVVVVVVVCGGAVVGIMQLIAVDRMPSLLMSDAQNDQRSKIPVTLMLLF